MSTNGKSSGIEGKVIRVLGPVIDVEFRGEMPSVYEALRLERGGGASALVLETEFVLENGEVRTLALGTHGRNLPRGQGSANRCSGDRAHRGKNLGPHL